MERLDSELWRFKLRGSLIRHLPLPLKISLYNQTQMPKNISMFIKYLNFTIFRPFTLDRFVEKQYFRKYFR